MLRLPSVPGSRVSVCGNLPHLKNNDAADRHLKTEADRLVRKDFQKRRTQAIRASKAQSKRYTVRGSMVTMPRATQVKSTALDLKTRTEGSLERRAIRKAEANARANATNALDERTLALQALEGQGVGSTCNDCGDASALYLERSLIVELDEEEAEQGTPSSSATTLTPAAPPERKTYTLKVKTAIHSGISLCSHKVKRLKTKIRKNPTPQSRSKLTA